MNQIKKYPKIEIGDKFGRLTVLSPSDKKVKDKRRKFYTCLCECGVKKEIDGYKLLREETVSCGCFRSEKVSESRRKHGLSKERLYSIWSSMRTRCYYESSNNWRFYGGKGISVCEEWKNLEDGYSNFRKWALDNDYQSNLTLDRIDSNQNYSPKNCRWANSKEQGRNKINTIIVEVNGIVYHSLSELSEETSMPLSIIDYRYRNGIKGDLLIYSGKTRISVMLAIQNGELSLDALLTFKN